MTAADKTHNGLCIAADVRRYGAAFWKTFNAGPDEVEALFAGALDAAYIGPSPTINAYGQSGGDAIRIIAGAASGGAQLIVRDGIDAALLVVGEGKRRPECARRRSARG